VDGESVAVLFPSSRDIVWYLSRTPEVGKESIFLMHAPSVSEASRLRPLEMEVLKGKEPSGLITSSFAVLSTTDEAAVRRAMNDGAGGR
jgi:hypothetical protein